MDRALPSNIQAEVNILSTVLVNPKKIVEVVNNLEIKDFYSTAHQELFKAILQLFAENKPIEIISIVETLGKDNLNKIGGVSYISQLMESGIRSTNINYNSKILKGLSRRRELIKLTRDINLKAYDLDEDLEELINEIQNKSIYEENKSVILNDEQLLSKTISEIEARYRDGGEIPGMKTGFSDFDRATNGLKKGEFTVIAGRPSMGKTLIALHLADGLADNGYKVGLFEMEMTEEALGMRRLSYTALVESYKLQRGNLEDKEWNKVSNAYAKLAARNNLYTDCSADNSILDIKAKAKLLKQQKGVDVIIIDHLTLLKISNRERRDLAIGEITRQCKLMAKELNINVIILSQLNRANEQRADKRPMLSDLRESGTIEQDADLVLFAHREDYYNKETEDKGIMEWIIAKQRNGKTGTLKFHYYDIYQKISNLDYIKR